jgi:hypothetical protein
MRTYLAALVLIFLVLGSAAPVKGQIFVGSVYGTPQNLHGAIGE